MLHSGTTQDALAIVGRVTSQETESIRDRLDQALGELLTEKRNSQVLRLVGGDYDYNKLIAAVATAPAGPFNEVWQQVRKLDLGDVLLVTPEDDAYSIHYFRPPECAVKSDLHFAAIGSGGIYGRAALTIQQYAVSSKISEALFQVYSAKKATEIVYGVGEPTDMAVLTKGKVIEGSSEMISLLERIRLKRSKYLLTEKESTSLKESIGLS